MKRIRLVALVVVVGALIFIEAGSVGAQEPVITPETQVDSATLHQWLQSGEPRLVAWAADFARRNHDAKILAEMPAWLEAWRLPLGNLEGSSRTVSAANPVLDALIQENARVPTSTIAALAGRFPAQAAILISRLPLPAAHSTLVDWSRGYARGWQGTTLARIALMILAKDPELREVSKHDSVGFIADVVAESENDIQIAVRSTSGGAGGGGGSCGDSLSRKGPDGWPAILQVLPC